MKGNNNTFQLVYHSFQSDYRSRFLTFAGISICNLLRHYVCWGPHGLWRSTQKECSKAAIFFFK